MKYLLASCLAMVAGSILTPTAGAADVFEQNRRLGRGVNIIGYDPLWRSRDQGRFQEKHFKLLKEAGFQSVRVNLQPFRHMDGARQWALRDDWLATLDWVVEQATRQQLMVILDCHEFTTLGDDVEGNKAKFFSFWRQLASHCRNAPDNVVFEILNEPCKQVTPPLWNQFLKEALAIIRESNPSRPVIIGPASWNAIDFLPQLELPKEDRNLIVTVHYYKPMEFTHQGAPWSNHKDLSGVEWRGTDAELQAIRKDFDKAAAWAKAENRPVFLGEFGAYDRAPLESRVRYTDAVARLAESLGWSWAYWQFDSDFILWDMQRDAWFEPILHALIPVAKKKDPSQAPPTAAAAERFPFVIPGDDATPSITNLAVPPPRPAGADGFVRIRDGRFFTDAGRFRVWGVNTCFDANFPTHGEAGKVAAHMAKLGINAVRMHHHDSAAAPRGLWGPVVAGQRTLSAEMVDRQDYFLNELHRNGIYANLNLHVGREISEAEGFPRDGLPYATRYDKYLLYFEPQARERLKEFCRDYLLHENPYRKLRRVDDPGIAMIEITNENSFSTLGPTIAAGLPEPHRGEFKRQWNAWLAANYRDTTAVKQAWGAASEPLGATLAESSAWRDGLGSWRLTQRREFPVRSGFGQPGPQPELPALLLEPQGAASELHAQELQYSDLKLVPGQVYTLAFWVRANQPRPLFFDVSNSGAGEWGSVGLSETLQLGTEWQRVLRVFRASKTIPGGARICFKFGGNSVPFALAGLTLRQGGDWIVLPSGQGIEDRSVEIPVAGWSEPAHRDVVRFMEQTEASFVREMVDFLKKDMGVRVPITASQINYHPPEVVAATCDYADVHAYWQHPRFPGKPWDAVDWEMQNTPMECAPGADALLARAPLRLLDRPYTLSEWNIPDPNDYAAGVVPFAAMVAALQDWDGIYFFQYHGGGDGSWNSDKVLRFFSFNGQPVKLALFTACANLYLRGDLAPLTEVAAGTFDQRVPASLGLTRRLGIDPQAHRASSLAPPTSKRLATPDQRVIWDASDAARAHVAVNTPATRAVWGLVGGRSFELGGVKLAVGAVERDYAAIVLTTMDGKPVEATRRALLTAVGSATNRGMKWNEARTSVGKDWGAGPAEVNGIAVEVTLPHGGARVFALDGRGQRQGEVIAEAGSAGSRFKLGSGYRTLWYDLAW